MKFNKNEEAVSPVIGVILMVAITVILAAVIAVFVFGMADDIQSSHIVAATAKMTDGTVIVTFQGGADASKVSYINATAFLTTGLAYTDGDVYSSDKTTKLVKEADNSFSSDGKPLPGYSMTFKDTDPGTIKRIVVSATFDDKSSQVILDKNF